MRAETQDVVRVGPAGWSYDDWKGIVYPKPMPRGLHPLELLSDWFDAIEVNATFYRPANPRWCDSWMTKVAKNPRFQFSAKLQREFTHERDAWPDDATTARFCDGLRPLKDAGMLGGLLAQFPWSFKRTVENRKWLGRLVETFGDWPLVVELRHTSWECPEVFEELARRNITFCNIDQPLFNDSVAPSARVTGPRAYVRLHGRNGANWFNEKAGRDERYDYLYSDEELSPWVERIQQMKRQVNDLFVVTNNHYRGQAVVNALEIQAAVGHARYALPDHLVDAYPRLKRLLKD